MAVIIGGMTTVSIGGTSTGFQSVNWATQVQRESLWQLGSWSQYKTKVTKTLSVNVTTYASVLGTKSLTPNSDCTNSIARHDISISAAACGTGGAVSFSEAGMFIMSYSYSKGDPTAFGTESWSFQKWVDAGSLGADYIEVGAPTAVIQGTAEGSKSGDATNLGVVMSADGRVTGSQGSVSAGFPGVGAADDTIYGIITQIGGGTLEESGKIGQSNCTIPHSPLYLG